MGREGAAIGAAFPEKITSNRDKSSFVLQEKLMVANDASYSSLLATQARDYFLSPSGCQVLLWSDCPTWNTSLRFCRNCFVCSFFLLIYNIIVMEFFWVLYMFPTDQWLRMFLYKLVTQPVNLFIVWLVNFWWRMNKQIMIKILMNYFMLSGLWLTWAGSCFSIYWRTCNYDWKFLQTTFYYLFNLKLLVRNITVWGNSLCSW